MKRKARLSVLTPIYPRENDYYSESPETPLEIWLFTCLLMTEEAARMPAKVFGQRIRNSVVSSIILSFCWKHPQLSVNSGEPKTQGS